MMKPGKYIAKARSGRLAHTGTGREQIALDCATVDTGETITWYGLFGDEPVTDAGETITDLTFKALRVFGWKGNDLTDLAGIENNEVELVVVHEEWKGKVSSKVKFVNKPGGMGLKSPMSDAQATKFSASMKAAAAKVTADGSPAPKVAPKSTAKNKSVDSSDDVPF